MTNRAALALTLLLGLATAAHANPKDRTAEAILKDHDAVEMPKYDPAKTKPAEVQAFREAYGKASARRSEFALELLNAQPDHPRLPMMLVDRWKDTMMSPQTAPATVAEIDRALPHFKDPKEARNASYMRAIATIVANKATPEKAIPVIDEYIRQDPKDVRGALLLRGLAQDAEDPILKRKLLDRMVAEFPDAPIVKSVAATRALLQQVGKPFAMTFDDAITGKPVSIDGLKGKVVVVDFWATWCGPCVAEMPKMKALYAEFQARGVEFIGVSLDAPREDGGLDKLKAYVGKNAIPWPQYYLGDGWDNPLIARLGIDAIPRVFLIDRDGNLASIDARGKLDTLIPKHLGPKN